MKQSLENELLELKEIVEQAKAEKNQFEGQRKEVFKQLELEWKCKTVEQAENELALLQKEKREEDTKLEQDLAQFKKQYDFINM